MDFELLKYLTKKIENQNVDSVLNDLNITDSETKDLLKNLFGAFKKNYIEASFIERQADRFNSTLLKYATHDFANSIELSEENDLLDSVAMSINLLGEELNYSTIAKDYLTDLFNSITDIVITIDNTGLIQSLNKSALQKLGYLEEDLVNKNINILTNMPLFLDTTSSSKNSFLTLDNEQLYVSIKISPFVRGNHEKIGYVVIAHDITEILKYQESIEIQNRKINEVNRILIENNIELKKAKEKAEESDRLKTSFLGNVSHEIRTPLNAIVGFSGMLKCEYNNDQHSEYIEIINSSCNKLITIVDDIIDISMIETKQINLKKTKTNISELIYSLQKSYYNKFKIEVIINNPDNEFELLIDHIRITQVLEKLLNNAIKYTDSGTIELGWEQSNNAIIFYVKDSGIGISEEKQILIFDRFRQAYEGHNRLYGGTGLGLPISKGFVELHGGKIWVKSKENLGSTFYFSIPLS
ncbi:MAG: PAS domain-containing sensor histidine kinase [Bacteroidota bacterium]